MNKKTLLSVDAPSRVRTKNQILQTVYTNAILLYCFQPTSVKTDTGLQRVCSNVFCNSGGFSPYTYNKVEHCAN
jgi:hypothetical protein